MEIADCAIVVTAITTVVYTVGTFLMWAITNKALKLNKKQFERNEQLLKTSYVSAVYKSFREIYSLIISNDSHTEIIANEISASIDDTRKEYIAIFLINHTFEIYNFHKNNLLPEDFWNSVVTDMGVLYNWSFTQERWRKMKPLFSTDFVSFIDKQIIRPNIF